MAGLADEPYRIVRQPVVSTTYHGEQGRVTQVSFVDDGDNGLQWRRSNPSTPVPTTSAHGMSLNGPRRPAYVLSGEPTGQADSNGVQWTTHPRSRQLQSTRTPLDPFQNQFGERSVSNDARQRRIPLQTIQVQTQEQEYARPIFSGNVVAQEPTDPTNNNGNCSVSADRCRQGREKLADLTVRSISLDITPTISEVKNDRGLSSDSRSWRGRAGQVLATGVFIDFTHGRLQIRTATGDVVTIPSRELSDDDRCHFAASWGIPIECELGDEAYAARDWLPMTMTWKASAVCHNPLYFEEVQLERYGHTAGPVLQPVISGAHFFFNIAVLPYKMGIHPMNECMYPVGTYREGDCAPWLVPPIPISMRGGLMQAGAIVGGIYVLP
ncbi:MAG: hypothetical protein ABGX07_06790 [Pirellulaceae bacterium]